MTVTLYASPKIIPDLIAEGVRSWSHVEAIFGVKTEDEVLRHAGCKNLALAQLAMVSRSYGILRLTFADEPSAMAFRLRYYNDLEDAPDNLDFASQLMALEAA